jgi:hypothetical protein
MSDKKDDVPFWYGETSQPYELTLVQDEQPPSNHAKAQVSKNMESLNPLAEL